MHGHRSMPTKGRIGEKTCPMYLDTRVSVIFTPDITTGLLSHTDIRGDPPQLVRRFHYTDSGAAHTTVFGLCIQYRRVQHGTRRGARSWRIPEVGAVGTMTG